MDQGEPGIDYFDENLNPLICDISKKGKSIPDNAFAMVAAEINGDAMAALPPFTLGFSVSSISLALLGFFPLFSSPSATATSAEFSVSSIWKRLYEVK